MINITLILYNITTLLMISKFTLGINISEPLLVILGVVCSIANIAVNIFRAIELKNKY